MRLPNSVAEFTQWTVAALAAIGAAWAVRHKASGDALGVKENQSKKDWIERQDTKIERQDLRIRELEAQNEICVRENAALRAKADGLTDQLLELKKQMDRFRRALIRDNPHLRELFGTDFGALDDGGG